MLQCRYHRLGPCEDRSKMSKDQVRKQQEIYSYEANSNLVIQNKKRRGAEEEGTGEAESLRGKLGGVRMGDRVRYDEPKSDESGLKKSGSKEKRARDDGESGSGNKPRKKSNTGGVIEMNDDFGAAIYKPKTEDSRAAYEEILAGIQILLGDQPRDILRGAADEVLFVLKDENLKDSQKKKEISDIVGSVGESKYTSFLNLSKRIVDFRLDGDDEDQNGADDEGIAVVFDDDDDEKFENDSGDDDTDEDEHGQVTSAAANLGSGVTGGADSSGDAKDGVLSAKDIDAHWLQRELSKFYDDANESAKLAVDVLDALQVADERACENKLVGLLDYDKFDLIKLLITNRAKIYYCTRLGQAQSEDERRDIQMEMFTDLEGGPAILKEIDSSVGKGVSGPENGGTFASRLNRGVKQFQNLERGSSGGIGEPEAEESLLSLAASDSASSVTGRAERNLDLESLQFSQSSHLMSNKSCELPTKSWRAQKKGYEEVHVPAIKAIVPPDERLVNIDELPEWATPAFDGIKSLNRIQSRMVDAALYSSENLLLCAPTGAGKTNVALMCILNQLGQHLRADGSFDLDAFKIVYVAPMKALVQENVLSLGRKLAPFGVKVAELSGDQNLTKAQIEETQIIVTTPEKWDIVTRKAGDRTYTQLVRLIIIDEIHLLHDERGAVLEALVARTLRQIEFTQEMVRLVGLSATLPNYRDVATFLRVKPDKGLFFFDSSFRPVPLQQQYIGVTEKKALKRFHLMNQICYEKVLQQAGKNQVLIFTHSRAETVKTAKALRDLAVENETHTMFVRDNSASREILREESEGAKSADLQDILPYGFAVHHAGLVRSDRSLVEDLFSDKHVQVLISTATLAWGVNLPCHTVIIKGTQMYSPEKGQWTELSPMDVLQMLGRAGRYGLDTEGEGIIMTQHSQLQFYLSLMNQQLPIESQYVSQSTARKRLST